MPQFAPSPCRPFRHGLAAVGVAITLAVAPVSSVFAASDVSAANASAFADIKIGGDMSSFTLDNGLEVVVIPDNRAPVATHMIWYRVGAADEPAGMSGIAHFLEHLMFKGTTNNPDGAFSKRIAEIGGQENAFTSNDYTAYFQRVAKEHLAEMMRFEADRMENLVLNDAVVLPERDVVLEERRQRVDSDPSAILGETLAAVLYVNHPYSLPIIGWEDEIVDLTKEDAIAFYDRFYTPNNAILIVAGDVTADEVRTLAEETYGKVARRAEPGERVRPQVQNLPGVRAVEYADPRVRQPNLRKAWLVPSYASDTGTDAAALDLLSEILGGGSTSRLYRALVVDQGVAASAGGWYQSSALDDTRFMVFAVPSDGTSLEDVASATRGVIDTLIEDGVSEAELERAKTSLLSSALYAQDSQSTLARLFGVALTTGSTIEDVRDWPAEIAAVTAEDVRKAAETFLHDDPVTGYLRTAATADSTTVTAQ